MRRRDLPLFCWALPARAAGEALRIGSWNRDSELAVSAVEGLLRQAYAELGQALRFEERPLRRAFTELIDGRLDGNLMRAALILADQPGLLRIDPPLLQLHYWSYGASPAPQQWQELAGRRVGMLRGVLLIERQLPSTTRRVEAGSPAELQRLLERGMVELVLSSEWALAPPLLSSPPRQPCGLTPTLLHHVLRRQHAAFAQRLGLLLENWRLSGRLEALLRAGLR